MEMHEAEITIDKEGRVQEKVKAGHGQDCLSLTKNLENALGEVQDREFLPEYCELLENQHQNITVR